MSNEHPDRAGSYTPEQLRQLLQSRPTDAGCRRTLAELDAYVTAQLAGEPYQTSFAETAVHLDLCLTCAQAYGLLYETYLADNRQQLTTPNSIPEPDLAFLAGRADEEREPLKARLQRQIKVTADHIQVRVTAALLPYLQPLPQTAVLRHASETRYGAILLCLTPAHVPEMTLPFTVMAYQDEENPDVCLVEVLVEPPGVSWPDLGGLAVKVWVEENVLQAETDDWGTAAFADVPVSALENIRVEVDL